MNNLEGLEKKKKDFHQKKLFPTLKNAHKVFKKLE